MVALADAILAGDVPAELAVVISNKEGALGLDAAKERGIPTVVVPHKGLARDEFEAELDKALEDYGADFVCLAGFMRILSAGFVEKWSGRMLNIHPSLLPSFRGLHVHEQALEARVAVSGCTVHLVTPELDGGPIVGQAVVPVRQDDTAESLASRIQKAEHRLYPLALRRVLTGRGPEPQDTEMLLSLR